METIIEIPVEYKRLFDKDWREAAIYGGRYCFDGSTFISLFNGEFKRIDNVVVGDKVLCMGGEYDIVSSVDSFKANFDPKPMFELEINGTITKTTYDHKYFNGRSYVPIYQLVWGIMDASQRRTLQLLCKQYGENTNNELQGWLQNQSDEASNKSQWLFDNSGREKNSIVTQNNSEDIHTKSREQDNSEPQEWNKDRQQDREYGMGDKTRTISTPLENRIKNRPFYAGQQLQENNGKRSERITTISLRKSQDADTNDGRTSTREDWTELQWDKRFAEWKNLETSTSRLSSQETDGVGSEDGRIRVKKVYESVDVWCIETEKNHNYFANGVNVSNSLKSHTVARYLLIRARMEKTRVACFREFQNSIADSSHQLLRDLINQYKLTEFEVTNNSIINTINGSDFLFRGLHNNEQSVKSIEGIDIAWVEEAQTVSNESIEVLTPTVRKEGSQILYTYNRLTEDDPVHTRLVVEGRPNTLVINVNYDIAVKYKMIPDVILKEIEDDKINRPGLFKQKWLGEPNSLERKIYKDWAIVEGIPHEARLERYGLDFGYTNDPSSIVAVYRYNGGYILDEITYQKGLLNKQLADIFKNIPEALVIADSAEPKSIDEIKSYGVSILPCTKGPGSVMQRIQKTQTQRISVTKRSSNILNEYRNYMWKIDKDGKVINEPDHLYSHSMDAISYALATLVDDDEIKPIFGRRNFSNPIGSSITNVVNQTR